MYIFIYEFDIKKIRGVLVIEIESIFSILDTRTRDTGKLRHKDTGTPSENEPLFERIKQSFEP